MPQADNERLSGRNGQIWQAYLLGHTQEAIAAEHGISQQRVAQILREIRKSIPDEDVAELRRVDLERLDSMTPANLQQARAGDKDGVKSVLAIMARRAALLGMDAPKQFEASIQRTQLDPEVEELLSAHEAAESTQSDEQNGA